MKRMFAVAAACAAWIAFGAPEKIINAYYGAALPLWRV